jgi:branched-chain amino acid transport system permease protein
MTLTVGRLRPSALGIRRSGDPSPGGSAVALLICAVGFLIFPFVVPEFQLLVSISFLTFAILTVSQVHVWGFGGIFSFAQAAFYALGAYAYAVIAGNLGESVGPIVAVVAAPLVVLALAAFLGFFIFYGKMGAFLLGIVTLSFSLMLGTFLNQTGGENYHIGKVPLGGYNGINNVSPLFIGGEVAGTKTLYFLTAIVLLGGVATVSVLRFRRIGIGIRAVAENPVRAELFGYNVRAYRLGIFVTGAGFAAAGGEFYAIWGSYTSPTLLTLQSITLPVVIAAIAGRDRAISAMLAGLVYSVVSQNLASSGASYALIVLGVGLVVVMLATPGGVGGWVASLVGRRLGGKASPDGPAEPAESAGQDERVTTGSAAGGRA